jgi:hypothetical protein
VQTKEPIVTEFTETSLYETIGGEPALTAVAEEIVSGR